MATRLVMRRKPSERIEVFVPHCPLFEEPKTAEYLQAVADGYTISMHEDGATIEMDEGPK